MYNSKQPFPQGNRRPTRKEAKIAAKNFVARMKKRLNDGGRSAIFSPIAIKVIERGVADLFVTEGRPFARQLSHIEAIAFLGDEADRDSCYAMGFAVDENGNPYSTPPVAAFRHADYEGPAPTAREMAERAEQAAFGVLFNKGLGLWPHRPAHTVRGRS